MINKNVKAVVATMLYLVMFPAFCQVESALRPNDLIGESSAYLLQHAYNPVDWKPWSPKVFERARREKKLVLVSIGYSSCHWCHVMEQECFEDELVAKYMNENFICVKVDREERPDVDQVYMTAVQLMTGSGGWPLNCFVLPDGRPVFGGTYFSREDWIASMSSLISTWKNSPEHLESYAAQIQEGIASTDVIFSPAPVTTFDKEILTASVNKWKNSFDDENGGDQGEPKFPLPGNLEFLMAYGHVFDDTAILAHVDRTLTRMALGGIYDQLGGGFARYSTDAGWKIPHFEKMLYDNALLLSLYSKAFKRTGNELFADVAAGIEEWLTTGMVDSSGRFYSSLDADSDGEEGLFYTWTEEELRSLTGIDYDRVRIYCALDESKMLDQRFVFQRRCSDTELCRLYHLRFPELSAKRVAITENLKSAQRKRIRPGLDSKCITSWNAMAIIGLLDVWDALPYSQGLTWAKKAAERIAVSQMLSTGKILHTADPEHGLDGFLDDYAFTITAFLRMYESEFEEIWIKRAGILADFAIAHFYDNPSGMFFYTSDQAERLITRKMEITDGVIPSSNSVMAMALFKLGVLTSNEEYSNIGAQMLANIYGYIDEAGPSYANWSHMALFSTTPFYEVAVTGPEYLILRKELASYYVPGMVLLGGNSGTLPLLEGKSGSETKIYVCFNKMCKKPVTTAVDAIEQMKGSQE